MADPVLARLSRALRRVVAPAALLVLLLTALYLAADAEGFGGASARWYPYVFVAVACALLLLAAAILQRLWRLRRQLQRGEPGARLTRRLLLVLVLLALPPVLFVYGFGVRFVGATVDSWLRVNSAAALEDALAIGQLYLDERQAQAQARMAEVAARLQATDEDGLDLALEEALDASGARQLALFESDGRLRAVAAADPALLLPAPPEEEVRLRLESRGRHVAAERGGSAGMQLRALETLGDARQGQRVLQGLFALREDYAERAQRVESALHGQRQASFLRDALKLAFVLILSFVALLSVLLALLLAFDLARRMVAPIARLAGATREVAEGRYGAPLPEGQDDELGFLARSFNRMTRELEQASARARSSAEETERQRAFLETVLASLTSGVLVLDGEGRLRSANAAAHALLGVQAARHAGLPLAELAAALPVAAPLCAALQARLREGAREWREEVALAAEGEGERRLLLVRGARLPDEGAVAVCDDTTVIDRARRDAAWAEVARRLAHEIKNPLTPIQLAAERLRRRVLPKLVQDDADVLDRATHTIVAQVDALKTLVNSFGDYARPPSLQLAPVRLDALAGEVLDLYEHDQRVAFERAFAPGLPPLRADAGRLRQVLHNLLKNALEATAERVQPRIVVATAARREGGRDGIELSVSDNGAGLPDGFDEQWFEPYRTTKLKGTGLGLAIVAKIAQEHGGRLAAARDAGGGARFSLWLPGE